jgi:hypothetical protein
LAVVRLARTSAVFLLFISKVVWRQTERRKAMFEKQMNTMFDFLADMLPDEKIPNTDGIFVFCHIEKRVAQHAAKFFLARNAGKIILSGGVGETKMVPGGFPSEAEYFDSIMMKYGIFGSILEKKASNTLENVLLGMKAAHLTGFYPKSLVLVALPPHLRRCRATFAKHFPNIQTFGSAFSIDEDEWQSEHRINRILGEIDRLKEYAKRGDMALVNIPEEVVSAYSYVSLRLKR